MCARCWATSQRSQAQVVSVPTMAFASKPGCPMCSIIASASHTTPYSPRTPTFPPGSTQPEVLWRDDNFTAYREKANPVSSKGHLVIAFKYAHSTSSATLLISPLVSMYHQYIPSYVQVSIQPSWSSLFLPVFIRPTSPCQRP